LLDSWHSSDERGSAQKTALLHEMNDAISQIARGIVERVEHQLGIGRNLVRRRF
jgi:hypothetical protein